ncbi:alpha/beta hydrolase [Streptomyces lydicus]|uniref:alpha/beta hydrolase n=1 Tax=Streptomyces lydicus TaxID=47763 RepID=UPI0037B12F96
MTTCPRRAWVLALSVTVLAGSLAIPTIPAAATAATPSSGLHWRSCEKPGGPAGQECAELSVPLDYRAPHGRQLTLAVSRLRSDRPAARRGTLLLIPGGPGGSGLGELQQKGTALRGQMAGAYDIVSFDPRGVGGSTTANCRLRADDRDLVGMRSWPDADGAITENVTRSRRIAEACDRHGGPVLRSMSTANEVRDIDRLRQALGEDRLSAWGVSYGTYVGAVYAQKYPARTDRWVLDSSGDPDPERVERGWLANMAMGADDRFPDFAAWAADPSRAKGQRLAEHPEDVRPLFLRLAAELDQKPKESTTPGFPLTGNRLRQALQMALYDDSSFPQLAQLIQAARQPDGHPALPAALARPLPQADAAATIATICNDARWPTAIPPYRRAVALDRARHPLTAGMPVNVAACTFWKDAPADKPTRITADGPSTILMVQNLRDPSTPYAGALKMRQALGDRARLVTVGHGGHGVYLDNGNACSDRTVTTFLTTGRRPQRDVHCADGTPNAG